MGKYSAKSGKQTGTPLFVWILVAVGLLVVLGLGSFFGYKILRGPQGTEALPAASNNVPTLPRPELPQGPALPESAETPALPEGSGLPQTEKKDTQLPEGPALPETEAKPEPKPAGPSGVVYWAATVHPFVSNMPMVQPQAGFQFVTAFFRIVNKSTATVHVDHQITAVQYQGQIYYPYVWASGMDAMANRRFLSPVDLSPNSMTEGYVAFQIPAGASGVEPSFTPQGLPPEVQMVRVAMDQLPSLQSPAPTRPLQ